MFIMHHQFYNWTHIYLIIYTFNQSHSIEKFENDVLKTNKQTNKEFQTPQW